MSTDLKIILCGWRDSLLTTIGNTLVGHQAFRGQGLEVQHDTGVLRHGRKVDVTIMILPVPVFFGSASAQKICDKTLTNFSFADFHAVIILTHIFPDLSVFHPPAVHDFMRDSIGQRVLKEKGLLLMTGQERFTDAQGKGDISLSFMTWCRQNTTTNFQNLFQMAQERCLLFSQDVLDCPCNQLIDMIDRHVVGGVHYIEVKIKDIEMRFHELADIKLALLQLQIQNNALKETLQNLSGMLEDLTEQVGRQNTVMNTEIQNIKDKIDRRHKGSL